MITSNSKYIHHSWAVHKGPAMQGQKDGHNERHTKTLHKPMRQKLSFKDRKMGTMKDILRHFTNQWDKNNTSSASHWDKQIICRGCYAFWQLLRNRRWYSWQLTGQNSGSWETIQKYRQQPRCKPNNSLMILFKYVMVRLCTDLTDLHIRQIHI